MRNGFLTVAHGTSQEPPKLPTSIARLSTGFFGRINWSRKFTAHKGRIHVEIWPHVSTRWPRIRNLYVFREPSARMRESRKTLLDKRRSARAEYKQPKTQRLLPCA